MHVSEVLLFLELTTLCISKYIYFWRKFLYSSFVLRKSTTIAIFNHTTRKSLCGRVKVLVFQLVTSFYDTVSSWKWITCYTCTVLCHLIITGLKSMTWSLRRKDELWTHGYFWHAILILETGNLCLYSLFPNAYLEN